MRRAAALLLLALCGALACGKYGPPLRPSERERAAEEAASPTAQPVPQQPTEPAPPAEDEPEQ